MQNQSEQNQKFESMFTRLDEEMRETKIHVTRLTDALSGTERGKLPSQTQPNPNNQSLKVVNKDKLEEVKAVTILRSGKEIDKNAHLVTKISNDTSLEGKKNEIESSRTNDIERCSFPIQFPQALQLPKNLNVTTEILEHSTS